MKKYFINLGLTIAGICVGFFIGEFITRNFYDFSSVTKLHFQGSLVEGKQSCFKLSDDQTLLYELKESLVKKDTFHEPGIFRIIILGDSTTFMGGSIENYYPKMLEDLLNLKLPQRKFEVINAGVIGYNTIQEAEYLKKRLIDYSPNLVIVGYCAFNDRTIKRKLIRYGKDLYCSDVIETYPYIIELPFNKYLLSRSALYRLINFALVDISETFNLRFFTRRIKYFDLSFETEKAIKEIRELALKNKFKLLFAVIPLIDKTSHAAYMKNEYDWIVEKCGKLSIEVLDLRNVFEGHRVKKLAIFPNDVCHFNKFGNQLIASAIYEYLKGKSSPLSQP